MQPRLIELADFTEYKYLTQNFEEDELNAIIDEAIEFDIMPVIGSALMYDLRTNQNEQKYIDLVSGKVYTPTGSSAQIEFKGLKMVLKYYVYARLLVADGVKSTASGMVHKILENSERISSAKQTQMINQTRSGAAKFESDMIKFLCNYSSIYPLYAPGQRKNKGTGFRINAI